MSGLGLNSKYRPSPRGAMTPPSSSNAKSSSVGPPVRATRTPLSGRKLADDSSGGAAQLKAKITAEQQLYIMEQIENGNYNKQAGIEQWANIIGLKTKPKCHQNLMSTFANIAVPFGETMTGANLNRKLFSNGNQDNLLNPSICSTIMGDGCLGGEIDSLQDFDEFGDEAPLVEYRTKIYQLMKVMDQKFRNCLEAQRLQSDSNISTILPFQSLDNLQKTLSRVTRSVEKFLDGNTGDNSKLFLQPNPNHNVILCPVEEHEAFIKGINTISDTLEIIDQFQNQKKFDVSCEKLLDEFSAELDKFEAELNAEEKASLEMKQLQKQLSGLSFPKDEKDFDISNTSSLSG